MTQDADIKHQGEKANTAAIQFIKLNLQSTFDDAPHPIRYWAAPGQHRPALVFLHSWSTDLNMDPGGWLSEAVTRGWHFLMPDFRGPNNNPNACGSPAARQDILDTVDFALTSLDADPTKIYLAGGSGGGHMALLMAGHHPDKFTAVSAWCGLSSVADFYHHHNPAGVPTRYANMVLNCTGGEPGSSPQADSQFQDRSPLYHLHKARHLPIDIVHGVRDGKPAGLVPAKQSIDGFNVLARAWSVSQVTPTEIQELHQHDRLLNPAPTDTQPDPDFESRAIYLRRHAGPSRITIFDGGHEALAHAGAQWLARHSKQ